MSIIYSFQQIYIHLNGTNDILCMIDILIVFVIFFLSIMCFTGISLFLLFSIVVNDSYLSFWTHWTLFVAKRGLFSEVIGLDD